jgi:hypothetical protein
MAAVKVRVAGRAHALPADHATLACPVMLKRILGTLQLE